MPPLTEEGERHRPPGRSRRASAHPPLPRVGPGGIACSALLA